MSKLPDCIIVGGGVVGLTIARRLAIDGLRVTLLERSVCGKEASWAGGGILAPCNPHRTDPLFHFQERSLAAFPDLCQALLEETGIDPQYERCGELTPLLTEQAVPLARSDAKAATGRSLPDGSALYELFTPDETRRIEPALSEDLFGSLLCRQTGQVRNPRLLAALRASCVKAGARIHEHTRVIDFEVAGDRVVGVKIADGTLAAPRVVLCAGAWSSQIGDRLTALMPVTPVRGQIVLLHFERRMFRPVIGCDKTYLIPRRDGHVLLGATEEPEAGFEKRITARGVSSLMDKAIRIVPLTAEAGVQAMWSGLRPGTPDNKPYLGPVPGLSGLIAATGHFRSGLTLAPATADVVAAVVQDRPYDLDLACCLPGRG